MSKTKMKCLIKSCDREVKTRGICNSCYQTGKQLVTTGRTNWAELETAGLCLPSKRKPYEKGVFMVEFLAKVKK